MPGTKEINADLELKGKLNVYTVPNGVGTGVLTYNGATKDITQRTGSELISDFGIWSSSNDGDGSGLNADLLDGKHLYEILASMVDKVVSNSTLTGIQNGVNKTFTLPNPYMTNSTRVYLNGVRQKMGVDNDYTEGVGNTIVFVYAPLSTDNIVIDFIKQ